MFVSIMALLTRISVHFIVVLIYIFLTAHVKYFLYLLAMFISFEIYSQLLAILKLHYLVFAVTLFFRSPYVLNILLLMNVWSLFLHLMVDFTLWLASVLG